MSNRLLDEEGGAMIGRKGYISVFALIVMSILMLIISYLVTTTNREGIILIHTRNNIQSNYLSEGKIQMVLYDKYYDEDFLPLLFGALRENKSATMDIILDNEDLDEYDSISNVTISLNKNSRMEFELRSESDYRGVKTILNASGPLINDFFEMGNPILNPSTIDNTLEEDFYNLLNKIYDEINLGHNDLPTTTYGGQFSNFEKIVLNQVSNHNYYLFGYRETMVEPYIEHIDKNNIVLIIKKYGDDEIDLFLGDEGEIDSPLELNGLIFVEGNITIFNKLNFNGIIILKDGDILVKSNERPKINGLIISSNDFNVEDLQITYDNKMIYKYGTYLPDFIDPKLLLFKNY